MLVHDNVSVDFIISIDCKDGKGGKGGKGGKHRITQSFWCHWVITNMLTSTTSTSHLNMR